MVEILSGAFTKSGVEQAIRALHIYVDVFLIILSKFSIHPKRD